MFRYGLALAALPVLAHAEPTTFIEGDVRVQVLSPTLVRLEVRGSRGFEDRPTFRVLQRDWGGLRERITAGGPGGNSLQTAKWTLTVPRGAKSLAGVRIAAPDGTLLWAPTSKEASRVWLPAPAKTPRAWAFADSPRIVPASQGAAPGNGSAPNSGWDLDNDATDIYVFLPDRSYLQLRRDFLRLTGPSEMPPLFMLGLIDSKYHPYTDREALDRIDQYRKRRIPLDVLTIDTDWRTNGSHGYTPDPRYFPDMPGFIRRAKAKGVRLMFNDHPEPQAPTALDPAEMAYRWKGLTDLMRLGLDVWWYDRNWSVSLHEPAPGIRSHVWGMRLFHDTTERFRPRERPVIMANTDGIDNGIRKGPPDVAAHRFSIQWTGDTDSTWAFLRRAVENAVQGGVEGLNPWINDDLGGHTGTPSPELYVRFMQYGSLCPVMRPHCTRTKERAPWAFGPEAERIVGDYVRLRYRLLPALYAAARESYDAGEPIVRRLDLQYPVPPESRRDDQYLLGRSLLVAPIVDGGPSPFPAFWAKTPWRAEYFADEELSGAPVLRREEAAPGFDLTGRPVAPEVPADHFSARWTGTVTNPSQDVVERLVVTADDGVRVWIDGRLVVDRWTPGDSVVDPIPVWFRPGVSHEVRIEYKELTGGAMMRLGLQSNDRFARRSLWLPPGTWTDLWTGDRLVGPKMIRVSSSLDEMPMFARAGGVIPTIPQTQRTAESPWDRIVLHAFAGADGTATLYEDDGHSTGYRANAFRRTAITMKSGSGRTVVTIAPTKGTYPGAVARRAWTLLLHPARGQRAVRAQIDGKPAKVAILPRNRKVAYVLAEEAAAEGNIAKIAVPAASVGKPISIIVTTR